MSETLFRREALAAHTDRFAGTIRIAQPPSFAVVTGCALAAAACLIAFAMEGEVTRRARLPGVLAPAGGVANVVAPQMGVVQSIAVQEGATVRVGDVTVMPTTGAVRVTDRAALPAPERNRS